MWLCLDCGDKWPDLTHYLMDDHRCLDDAYRDGVIEVPAGCLGLWGPEEEVF